jgi:hypothetical protein
MAAVVFFVCGVAGRLSEWLGGAGLLACVDIQK